MRTLTIPVTFSMNEDYSWMFANVPVTLHVPVALDDNLTVDDWKKVIEANVKAFCDKAAYRYAMINQFAEDGTWCENEEQQMQKFIVDGLFDPKEEYGGLDTVANFNIWLEESFFDLDVDKQFELVEKYYGYLATRLTEDKLKYEYSYKVPENL